MLGHRRRGHLAQHFYGSLLAGKFKQPINSIHYFPITLYMSYKKGNVLFIYALYQPLINTFGQAGQTFPESKSPNRQERCLVLCLKNLHGFNHIAIKRETSYT